MKGIFVTGTDTGVGKTLIAAALIKACRAMGRDAVPMKPVQTGCRRSRGAWVAPDLETSLRASRIRVSAAERLWMAPYCFGPACSPHLAARGAGIRISLPRIRQAFRRLARLHDIVVVEGAGGVLVPLDDRLTMLDLMVDLGLPVLLVARPGLGTINHTLLSLHALRRAGRTVVGVVFNSACPGRQGAIERDNRQTIERMGGCPVLADIPFGASTSNVSRLLEPIAELVFGGGF
jgi:dethiobiotin synthetase